VSRFLTAHQQK